MDKELETMEVAEKEDIEGAAAGALLPLGGDEQLFALETIAKNADRMIAAKQKVWNVLLKIAKPGDWTVFGSQGKQKAELGHGGAMRYAAFLGISFTNWSAEKATGTDEKGQWYRWDYECDTVFAGRTIRTYGRAGSRDKFFGKEHGEYKELHDVDEGNLKIAARRAAMKEGVKTLLGLHHIPPAELEAAGVKMGSASGYDFKSDEEKKTDGAELKTLTANIEKVTQRLVKVKGKDTPVYTIHATDGDKFDTWSETDAKVAKASMEDKKSVTIGYITNQYGNNIKTLVTVDA